MRIYINVSNDDVDNIRVVHESDDLNESVTVDRDANGDIVGVEIRGAAGITIDDT